MSLEKDITIIKTLVEQDLFTPGAPSDIADRPFPLFYVDFESWVIRGVDSDHAAYRAGQYLLNGLGRVRVIGSEPVDANGGDIREDYGMTTGQLATNVMDFKHMGKHLPGGFAWEPYHIDFESFVVKSSDEDGACAVGEQLVRGGHIPGIMSSFDKAKGITNMGDYIGYWIEDGKPL